MSVISLFAVLALVTDTLCPRVLAPVEAADVHVRCRAPWSLEWRDAASGDARRLVIDVRRDNIYGDKAMVANLNKLDEAVSEYENAVNKANGNPMITPFILIKMANVYAQQKNYAKEYECYNTIRTDYQAYVQQARINIDKYVERARIRAGK